MATPSSHTVDPLTEFNNCIAQTHELLAARISQIEDTPDTEPLLLMFDALRNAIDVARNRAEIHEKATKRCDSKLEEASTSTMATLTIYDPVAEFHTCMSETREVIAAQIPQLKGALDEEEMMRAYSSLASYMDAIENRCKIHKKMAEECKDKLEEERKRADRAEAKVEELEKRMDGLLGVW